MTKISQLSSIGDSLAIGDQFLIRDIDDAANPNKSVTVSGITRALDLGTAAAPALAFASNKNSGLFSPGADQLAASTGGSERLRITSAGLVGIGTSAPSSLLDISGGYPSVTSNSDDYRLRWRRSDGSFAGGLKVDGFHKLTFALSDAGGITQDRMVINVAGNVGIGTTNPSELLHVAGIGRIGANDTSVAELQIGAGATGNRLALIDLVGDTTYTDFGLRILRDNAGANSNSQIQHRGTGELRLIANEVAPVVFWTQGTERARIDSSGRLLVGASSGQGNSFLQIKGDAGGSSGVGSIFLQRGLNIATIAGAGNVDLAKIEFGNQDGAVGAVIQANADATWGTNDYPSRLTFSTTADGAPSPTERLRITSAGNVGIGTASPANKLDVSGAGNQSIRAVTTDTSGSNISRLIAEFTGGGGLESIVELRAGSGYSFLANATNTPLLFGTNGTERARIDSSGRLLVGTSTARANILGTGGLIQSEGANNDGARAISVVYGKADAADPLILLGKHRSNSLGGTTVVNDGDGIGQLVFTGADGTNFISSASIRAQVDGTPGANDMPGRLIFSTTSDSASSPTERLRITSAGVLQVADAGNIQVGTTTGTKIGTATTQKLGFYNATPVVQPAAVADATTAVDVITQLNDLLAKLRTLGIIAT